MYGDFYIYDVNECTTDTIYSKIKELENIYKFDLIVVDYLGIMEAVKKSSQLWERERQIALELKQLARRLNTPIITVMQVRKKAGEESKKRDFEAEDVALSYEIIMQSDIFFTWQVQDEEGLLISPVCQVNVVLKKVRNNPRGKFSCIADFEKMRVVECTRGF